MPAHRFSIIPSVCAHSPAITNVYYLSLRLANSAQSTHIHPIVSINQSNIRFIDACSQARVRKLAGKHTKQSGRVAWHGRQAGGQTSATSRLNSRAAAAHTFDLIQLDEHFNVQFICIDGFHPIEWCAAVGCWSAPWCCCRYSCSGCVCVCHQQLR